MRRFNVTGFCVPEEDYMVDISGKAAQVRKLIDERRYFTINRARQYGKTTMLRYLERTLRDDYTVALINFEELGPGAFESADAFCAAFVRAINKAMKTSGISKAHVEGWTDKDAKDFERLGNYITQLCQYDKIVLMIDEVDKTSNNRVFLYFLGLLRGKFMARKARVDYTFHSVILAGVHDVRNLKQKLINEGVYTPEATEGKLLNSPWNIAVNFNVDMSFNSSEIASMLREYESDHNTGMDISAVSEEIFSYTGGYPFLVSRICQCIDEELSMDWTHAGIQAALKKIYLEKNTLFDDLIKNIESNDELRDLLYDLLIVGDEEGYNVYNPVIDIGTTYGFITKDKENKVVVANKIFEILIYDYFISKDKISRNRIKGVLKRDVVSNGHFDMELCLKKFAEHYTEIFNDVDERFIEREGTLLFLSYLKPLINGQGFYHVESQLMDRRRMDIVVDYGCDQFIIELKLWKGEAKHEEAYEQLAGYLDKKNVAVGYLLTFDFRKDANKEFRTEWVEYEGKRIFDVVV